MQLSENVRRSTELKTKNGERCGVAPLGYENYVDERGKHNIRLKEPEAGIIKQIFELYSLGKMSILEAVHFADLMGLRTRAGKKLVNSSIYYILDNPFYYGEMKTKRGIIKHVYSSLLLLCFYTIFIMSCYFGNVRKKMHPFVTFLLIFY